MYSAIFFSHLFTVLIAGTCNSHSIHPGDLVIQLCSALKFRTTRICIMVFATFQGELVDIVPASPLGSLAIAMLSLSLSCQLASVASIFRGYIALPSRIIPWMFAVFAMDLAAVLISLVICLSDRNYPSDPAAQWLAYLLFMNAATGASLCELELFKMFTVLTPDLQAQDISRIQIIFFIFSTLGLVGHYAHVIDHENELAWLALV